jgi:hypothetical protein
MNDHLSRGEQILDVNGAELRSALWLPPFDDLAAAIAGLREHVTAPYDIAIALPPGTDPAPYAKAGATWCLTEFDPEAVSLDQVRGVLRSGPALRSGSGG